MVFLVSLLSMRERERGILLCASIRAALVLPAHFSLSFFALPSRSLARSLALSLAVRCAAAAAVTLRNFRTESSPQWDFLQGLEMGYIPNPVTNRTFSCAQHNKAHGRRRPRRSSGGMSEGAVTEEQEAEQDEALLSSEWESATLL